MAGTVKTPESSASARHPAILTYVNGKDAAR